MNGTFRAHKSTHKRAGRPPRPRADGENGMLNFFFSFFRKIGDTERRKKNAFSELVTR
jgi:hypothetical protein